MSDAWETDEELALRFLARRWLPEVEDLLERSQGELLAFDDLDLDGDLDELTNAVSRERLRRLALRGLMRTLADEDPEVKAVDAEPGVARAFVRLVAANLAFALRTDDLLAALVANAASGAPPRMAPRDVGALLARARSARKARELVATLEEPARTEALAAIAPSSIDGDYAVLHARVPTEELAEAVERVMTRRGLVAVPWIKAPRAERYIATRRRGGWSTLLHATGVERALAQELSTILGPVAWAEKKGEAMSFALFERGKATSEETVLDEASGALRALGITAHDGLAPGKKVPLAWLDYVPEGENSPARLRKMSAVGIALLPKDEARRAKSRS